MALIAYLTIYCRMPRRVVEAFLEHVLGIAMSLGSTQKCWEQASAAVAKTRSSAVPIHLLGAVFAGILCSDLTKVCPS